MTLDNHFMMLHSLQTHSLYTPHLCEEETKAKAETTEYFLPLQSRECFLSNTLLKTAKWLLVSRNMIEIIAHDIFQSCALWQAELTETPLLLKEHIMMELDGEGWRH